VLQGCCMVATLGVGRLWQAGLTVVIASPTFDMHAREVAENKFSSRIANSRQLV
jgi:hypothetical protein